MEGRLSSWSRRGRRALRLPGAVVVALAAAGPHDAAAQPGRISMAIDTVAEADVAHAGATHRVALEARLQPAGSGLHVNSNEPLEDFLIPTALTVRPPAGMAVAGLAWPEPALLEQQGAEKPLAVYGETFAVGVALAVDPDVAPGEYEVPASLRYQACDDRMCYIPATERFAFRVRVAPGGRARNAAAAELFDRMVFTASGAGDPPGIAAPPPPAEPVDEGDALARLDRFTVAAATGGYLDEEQFLAFIRRAEAGEAEPGWFEGRGPLAILALILLGGLALNLTPCVLPMIPINLAIIGAGARAGSRLRGFLLGGAYGLAMAQVYGVLGLVVILTAGTFGTINSSPWFNLGIALLFVVLTLAMFDVVTIDFSRFQGRIADGSPGQGSFLLAFGMGGVAALLAGACVAPVVIQVVVFSSNLYGQGATLALALPFVLGVGMAIPGRSPAPAWRSCRGPAPGWCVSSTPSASSSWARPSTTGTCPTTCSASGGSIPTWSRRACRSSSAKGGTRRSPGDSPRPRTRARRCSSTSGPPGARTASPWTARRSRRTACGRRSTSTSRSSSRRRISACRRRARCWSASARSACRPTRSSSRGTEPRPAPTSVPAVQFAKARDSRNTPWPLGKTPSRMLRESRLRNTGVGSSDRPPACAILSIAGRNRGQRRSAPAPAGGTRTRNDDARTRTRRQDPPERTSPST